MTQVLVKKILMIPVHSHKRNRYDHNNNVNSEESFEDFHIEIEEFDWSSNDEVSFKSTEQKRIRKFAPQSKKTPVVDIEKVAASIKKRETIIFCRVSSYGQTGPFCISFDVQEQKGNACANKFKLKVMGVIKMVESAYTGKSCTIKSLITKNRGKNIIIYDVSRFCRNINRGMELLDYALQCNTRLFFVSEGIIWDKEHLGFREKLRQRLHLAEEESRNLARRIKDAKEEKKRRGFHTGGLPKYGYKVLAVDKGKILVPEEYEQKVINFIKLCLTTGTSVKALNILMEDISPNFGGCPIVLDFNGKEVNAIQDPLSYAEIADLLNIYEIPKRGGRWTASNVGKIAKKDVDDVVEIFDKMKMDNTKFY